MATFTVLWSIVELVDGVSVVNLVDTCGVAVVCHDLRSHVGSHLFAFFPGVLQVLRRCSSVAKTLVHGNASWNRSFPFLLHLLLTQSRIITFFLEDPVILAVSLPTVDLHAVAPQAAQVLKSCQLAATKRRGSGDSITSMNASANTWLAEMHSPQ